MTESTEKKKRKARKFVLKSTASRRKCEINGVLWLSNHYFMAPESMVTVRGGSLIHDTPAMQTVYDWHRTKELHPLNTDSPEVYHAEHQETVYAVRDSVTGERVFFDSILFEPVEKYRLAMVNGSTEATFAFNDANEVAAIIMPLRPSVMLDELADQLREVDERAGESV